MKRDQQKYPKKAEDKISKTHKTAKKKKELTNCPRLSLDYDLLSVSTAL